VTKLRRDKGGKKKKHAGDRSYRGEAKYVWGYCYFENGGLLGTKNKKDEKSKVVKQEKGGIR